eukprot:15436977-Alexandrium_andersonii.AAC.1
MLPSSSGEPNTPRPAPPLEGKTPEEKAKDEEEKAAEKARLEEERKAKAQQPAARHKKFSASIGSAIATVRRGLDQIGKDE